MQQPRSIAGIRIVDSTIAQQAREFAADCYAPHLLNHAVRTYVFGSLIGKATGASWDEELVYLAAILHDIGLTAKHMGPLPFEIEGAQTARRFLHDHGVPNERADIVWDGIALHASAIAEFKPPEIRLIALGADADVTGGGLDLLPRASVDEVLHYAPRLNFKQAFVQSCADVVRRQPRGATRSFMRDIGERHVPGFTAPNICDAIANAPFPEQSA